MNYFANIKWRTDSLGTIMSLILIFSDEHCKRYYQQKKIRSYVNEEHMCAGYFDQRGACTGDAGGPLMCLHGGSPMAAGILTWAEGCRLESTPAVFSDIKHQLSFIKSVINNPCLGGPCQNSGTCVENEDALGYKCECDWGFAGNNCEIDLQQEQKHHISYHFDNLTHSRFVQMIVTF